MFMLIFFEEVVFWLLLDILSDNFLQTIVKLVTKWPVFHIEFPGHCNLNPFLQFKDKYLLLKLNYFLESMNK